MMRTHLCGELRQSDIGSTVSVAGWVNKRREHGEHLAFVDVRDYDGVIQCVVDNTVDVRSEYVIKVTGTVTQRPEGTTNDNLNTGQVEITDAEVEILSAAEPPPFPLDERANDVDEQVRLRYRYLDLRREQMQKNLRTRANVNSAIRASMESQGFVEVETPMLMPTTPEGAREFIVPSRRRPGSFFALPQSPQLFKQLLMVGGFDRYYQIARCLRDEDLRVDRQYEFMQLDLEMSFAEVDDVLAAVTESILSVTEAVTGERPAEIPQITWHDAMNRFGSDKPDLRFEMELVELTDIFANTGFKAFGSAEAIKGLKAEGAAGDWGRNKLDGLTEEAKKHGAKGLVWIKVSDELTLDSPVAKFFSDDEKTALVKQFEAKAGDLLLIVADEWLTTCEVLGEIRNKLGRPAASNDRLEYLWVVDFPLFVGKDKATGLPRPGHHPFCHPHPEDVDKLETDPTSVRAWAYDLVLNGWELGSGSIRIHDPAMQRKVFGVLGIDDDEAQKRFGFFLTPFNYGAPPHGGFAYGIDRLTAILAGEDNIREVIAFPKPQSGADPMTESPTEIDESQLTELGLKVIPQLD